MGEVPRYSVQGGALFHGGKQQNKDAFLKEKINPRPIKSQMVNLHAVIIPQYYCVAFTLL